MPSSILAQNRKVFGIRVNTFELGVVCLNENASINEVITMKYVCPCGYEYDPAVGDPDNGIAPGTPWEELPEDWTCPICGLDKDAFEAE